MKKGSPVYRRPSPPRIQWDDKESGKKQSRLKITGEEFQFLGGKGESGGSGQGGGGQYDEEGGSSRSSGGYSQSRPPQQQQRPPQNSGGYSQSGGSGGGNASPQGQSRPDAFPPGLDDDEIPF